MITPVFLQNKELSEKTDYKKLILKIYSMAHFFACGWPYF